jgi:glycosyltransferase involved in cell wall biosynthesis
LVAGKGPSLEHFKAEVARRKMEENIRFLGFVPDKDLPSLYQAADAFLMTSTFETQGIALLEAMAAGLPVVATDLGGPTEFVRTGENGFLFEARNPVACAEKLRGALDATEGLRGKARATAKPFTAEAQSRILLDAYTEIIDARRASS